MERFKLGLELQWDYYGPFGFAAVLADADEDPYPLDMRVTADLLIDKQVAIVGTPDQVVEQIMAVKEGVGYEDFLFTTWFEIGGYSHDEVEHQMQWFASDCMPQLADACGGMVVNPPANAVAPDLAAVAGD